MSGLRLREAQEVLGELLLGHRSPRGLGVGRAFVHRVDADGAVGPAGTPAKGGARRATGPPRARREDAPQPPSATRTRRPVRRSNQSSRRGSNASRARRAGRRVERGVAARHEARAGALRRSPTSPSPSARRATRRASGPGPASPRATRRSLAARARRPRCRPAARAPLGATRFTGGVPTKRATNAVSGAPFNLARRAHLLERAVAQDGDAIRERHRLSLVVRHVDEGRPELFMKPRR